MNVFLVSDDESFARSIRQVMIREGVDCPISSTITYGQAGRRLARVPVDLIVAVLPEDPLRSIDALDLLAAVPRSERTLVIAVGPAADARLVIRALRGVVDDYVDISEMEADLGAVLGGWRRRWAQDRPEGRLVAVLAPSGGAGSSTIAASLAAEFAKDLESVALIDLKLETGDLAALLDLKPVYSLADLSKNIDRLDRVFFERALVQHACGVHLLSAPYHLADADLVTPEGVRQAIGLARATFPFVVVDMDHTFGEEQLHVLRQADIILLVLRLDFTSLKNAVKFFDHLDGLGLHLDRVRLVVNRFGQPREVPIAKVEEALNSKVFHTIPDDPRTVNRANNYGVPVVLDAPSSRFAKGLSKLAQGIRFAEKSGGGNDLGKAPRLTGAGSPKISRWDAPAARAAAGADLKTRPASPKVAPRVLGESGATSAS
jgi:pilus assembly protein CpaE